MDRDPGENHLDPVEREIPSTGRNDTGEVGGEAARIMKDRRKAGTAGKQARQPVQAKQAPRP